MVGRQTPVLALLLPFILLGMVDGRRGIRQAWPVALVGGFAFAAAQFTCSNHVSVALTDIVAAISSLAAIVALLHVWTPAEPLVAQPARGEETAHDSPRDILRAYAPYLVILAVFSIAQLPAVKSALAGSPWTASFQWPGLDVRTPDGAALPSLTFRFDWLPAAGTLMLISGLITMAVIGLAPGRALRVGRATLIQLRGATLVVTAVLALAYVVNQSGQTLTLGLWAAGAGPLFAFLAPAIGWLGVAVTGSDTASNALFGGVQVAAANHTGIPANPARGRERVGWRAREDDLDAAPRHRGRGRRPRGARGRALSQGRGLEHRPAAASSARSSTCNRPQLWTGWWRRKAPAVVSAQGARVALPSADHEPRWRPAAAGPSERVRDPRPPRRGHPGGRQPGRRPPRRGRRRQERAAGLPRGDGVAMPSPEDRGRGVRDGASVRRPASVLRADAGSAGASPGAAERRVGHGIRAAIGRVGGPVLHRARDADAPIRRCRRASGPLRR